MNLTPEVAACFITGGLLLVILGVTMLVLVWTRR